MLLLVMLVTAIPVQTVQASVYQRGSYGVQVQILQQNLTFLGFSTKGIDGSFGNNTKNAVLEVQKALGFEATGKVEDELNTMLKNTVLDIQKYMQAKGYYTGALDGVSGVGTQGAFKALQKEKGYPQTGVASYFILKEIIDDTSMKIEMKSLREWVARLNGTYGYVSTSDYYVLFGEDYTKLFTEYPQCLHILCKKLVDLKEYSHAYRIYKAEIEKIDGDVGKTVITDGLSMIVDSFLSSLGLSKDTEAQIRYDAIMTMVLDLYQDKSVAMQLTEELDTAFSAMGDIYSGAEDGAKKILVQELAKRSESLTMDTIGQIVDSIFAEHSKDIKKFLGTGTTVIDYAKTALQLYELDGELLNHLQKVAGEGTDLYMDIELLKAERKQDPVKFFTKKFLSETAKEVLAKSISTATGGLYDVITEGADNLSELLGNASVQEKVYASNLTVYCEDLSNALYRIMDEMKQNSKYYIEAENAMLIDEFEFTYKAYVSSLGSFYESVGSMTSKKNAKLVQEDINVLNAIKYEDCIKECMEMMRLLDKTEENKPVVEKMDKLFELVGNKYFTTTQTACKDKREGNHSCSKCLVSNVINASWFKEAFGTVNYANFPQQHYNETGTNNNGWSCFGFTCFAQYYIFAENNTQKLTSEKVASGKFSKEFAKSNIQPGDVIRLENSHSALVYAVTEEGVVVIDSNADLNKLNCLVEKHTIRYDGYYNGKNIIVDRVIR